MNEREYAQKVAELVGGTVVTSRKNGVMITQVTIPKEGIQKLYPVGVFMTAQKSPEWMAGYIRADSAKKEDLPDVKWMLKWEEVKQHLKARLKHRDTEPEVCRSAREYGLDDLMIEPFVEVDIPGGLGAAEIKPEMLNVWNVPAKEVIDIALDNIRNDVVIKDMAEQLGELAAEIGEKYLGELPEDYPQADADRNERGKKIRSHRSDLCKREAGGAFRHRLHADTLQPGRDDRSEPERGMGRDERAGV